MSIGVAQSPMSVAGHHLLIVGLNYWPEETGNAPYTTGLAEHLVQLGANVSVACGMPYYPQWSVAEGYRDRWRMREERNGVAIHRFRQYVPGQQSALRRSLFEGTFFAHAATIRGIGRPSAVVGILPSLSDGLLAAAFARRFRVPYGLLIQDLVGRSAAQSGIAGGSRVARATESIEGKITRGAVAIGVVSDGFRSALGAYGVEERRVALVRNWSHVQPPSEDRHRTRHNLGWNADEIIVLHAGNMGLKQGLENVVDAARLAGTDRRLRFVLMGDGNQRAMLQALATDVPNLTFLPPQPADQFVNVLAAADILLVNERATVRDMSLPSKLTSYCVAGRPVIAAVAPEGVTAREVVRSGGGVAVAGGDPLALCTAVQSLADDPERREQLGAAGRAYARDYLAAEPALARASTFVASILNRRPPDEAPVLEQIAGLSTIESV